MWFSLGLHTCNLTSRYRTGTNPFSGEPVRFPLDDGLTDEERFRFRAVLGQMHASAPDPGGYRAVRCPDGGEFTISVGVDPNVRLVSCDVTISQLTDDAIAGIFSLARAANIAIGSSIDPDVVALTSTPQGSLIKNRWPDAKVVGSPEELRTWLTDVVFKQNS